MTGCNRACACGREWDSPASLVTPRVVVIPVTEPGVWVVEEPVGAAQVVHVSPTALAVALLAGSQLDVLSAVPTGHLVAWSGCFRRLHLAVLVVLVTDGPVAAVHVLWVVAPTIAVITLLAPQLLLAGRLR